MLRYILVECVLIPLYIRGKSTPSKLPPHQTKPLRPVMTT